MPIKTPVEWVKEYRGNSSFFLSLQKQYKKTKTLSPRQIECVQDAMRKETDQRQMAEVANDLSTYRERSQRPFSPESAQAREKYHRQEGRQQFSYKPGDFLEIKPFTAGKIQEQFKTSHAFRNIEILEILRESSKAVQVRFRYVSKVANSCHLCGQKLDTEISRACGIGPVCAEKIGFHRPKLKDADAILAEMDKIAQATGDLGPVWVAKSQIVDAAIVNPNSRLIEEAAQATEEYTEDELEHFAAKNEFARREAEQERKAFMSKMDREPTLEEDGDKE